MVAGLSQSEQLAAARWSLHLRRMECCMPAMAGRRSLSIRATVPCGGCADFEFPSAEVYIDDVGIGARRTGSYYECLCGGSKGSVSVLLLWGCDVHPLEVPRNSILNTEVYMQARVLLRRVTACIFMFVCHTSIFSQGIFSC